MPERQICWEALGQPGLPGTGGTGSVGRDCPGTGKDDALARSTAEVERDTGISEALQDADFMRLDAELVRTEVGAHLRVNPGTLVGFPYLVQPRSRALLNFKVKAPKDAQPGDKFTVQIKQRNATGEVMGEYDIHVNVVAKK